MSAAGRLRFDDEDENVGRDAAETAAREAESGVRAVERRVAKTAGNPASKRMQRQAIKKQYAAARAGRAAGTAKTAEQAARATGKAAEKTAEGAKKAAQFLQRHKKGFAIAGALLLSLSFVLNVLSSCSVLVESVAASVSASTYPAGDADMLGAEAAYRALEAELQEYLDTYEETHDYNEYHYDLDGIEHDPYVLVSMLTAWHQGTWKLDEVSGTLQLFFDRQYTLAETVTTETRTRMVDGAGETYEYSICNVTLDNFNLSHLPVYIMDEDRLSMYATYMGTLGNRSDLFPDSEYVGRYSGGYTDYEIPQSALEDTTFAAIITEAKKYLGYPYVWGGSSPSTSFDCSGFVSWVINHSGWNVGRLGAQGLYNICTRVGMPKPGDLVFFRGTYDTPGISHVGIYVGNSMMIHCGDPISYSNLNSSYWQAHFAGYGRLP